MPTLSDVTPYYARCHGARQLAQCTHLKITESCQMLLYLKTGTGEPCAGQVRAREFNKERESWSPLDSWENLGAELPTGSRIEEYIQIFKRRKACSDGCPKA
jgi:hypothetical protein